MLADIFVYSIKKKVTGKQWRQSKLHSLVNAVSCFAQSDNSFEYWKNISWVFCTFHNVTATPITFVSLICIINIYSITFLSLGNQQNNKTSAMSVASADFHGVNTLTVVNFKLPMWHYLLQSWEELCRGTPVHNISIQWYNRHKFSQEHRQ